MMFNKHSEDRMKEDLIEDVDKEIERSLDVLIRKKIRRE